MHRSLFCIVMAAVLVAGCSRREDMEQLKAICQSLENSNAVIQENNEGIKEELFKKKLDMRYFKEGEIWEPRASRIKEEADSIVLLIEKLKSDLLKATDSLKNENATWVKQFSASDGPAYNLVKKLVAFRDKFPAIMSLNDFIDDQYEYKRVREDIVRLDTSVPLLPGYVTGLNEARRRQYINNWVEERLSPSSPAIMLVLLNKIENDLLVTTNRYMDICLDKTKVLKCGYPYGFGGVATLSSSYVKKGQPIEVSAGIGEFTSASNPRITIGGKLIELNQDAVAVHQFIAAGKPGKHTVRVQIEFTRPDGTTELVFKDLKYIIADEK